MGDELERFHALVRRDYARPAIWIEPQLDLPHRLAWIGPDLSVEHFWTAITKNTYDLRVGSSAECGPYVTIGTCVAEPTPTAYAPRRAKSLGMDNIIPFPSAAPRLSDGPIVRRERPGELQTFYERKAA